jgi:hypothetical protein
MTEILWSSNTLHSCEAFVADEGDEPRLRGALVLPLEGRPAHIHYKVTADAGWVTRSAEVVVSRAGTQRRLCIESDGDGHWTLDAQPRPDLDGCLDVDLGWTPATNTLPIRRLGLGGLDVGQEQGIDVAWLRYPELRLERARQNYRRVDEHAWIYRSGSFSARLTVDAGGYVRRYGGDGLWVATAAHP